jgi:hypothetical protein
MKCRRANPPQLGATYSQNSGGNCRAWSGGESELQAELRAATGSASFSCGQGDDGISVAALCRAKYGPRGVTAQCEGGFQGWSCVGQGEAIPLFPTDVYTPDPLFFDLVGEVYHNSQNQPCCAYNQGTGCDDWHLKECYSA